MEKNHRAIFQRVICAAILLLGAEGSLAQNAQVTARKINFPHYDASGQLRALFSAADVRPLPGGLLEAKQFSVRTFRNGNTNDVEVNIVTAQCIIDQTNTGYSAWSPGRLQLFTATTNYFIEGRGFLWQQSRTNAHLVISNDVHTIIRNVLTNQAKSGPPLEIRSRHFDFEMLNNSNLETRVVRYQDEVRVNEEQATLACDRLLTELPPAGGTMKNILAEENVVFISKSDQSRITAQRALYRADAGLIEMTGSPRWTSADREGTAEVFYFDRNGRTFRAQEMVRLRFPKGALAQPVLFSPASVTDKAAVPGATNYVYLNAGRFLAELPSTNGPIQRIVAEQEVVITSDSDQSRATGEKFIYNAATGVAELGGKPVWRVAGSEIRAEKLSLSATNKSLLAERQVQLEVPAHFFSSNLPGASSSRTALTNQVLSMRSERFEYNTNLALFTGQVRGELRAGKEVLGKLAAEELRLGISASNQITEIKATGGAELTQLGAFPNSNVLWRAAAAEEMLVRRSPATGFLKAIEGRRAVSFREKIQGTNKLLLERQFQAETVESTFEATNRLATLHAAGNVRMHQGDTEISGQSLLFPAPGRPGSASISGHPLARNERVRMENATTLFWDNRTGKLSAEGLYRVIPVGTNGLDRVIGP